MKLALRLIPTEVWVEIFCYPWITRKRLAKIVDKFKNRKFTDYLQFFLHEWGKQSLGALHLDKKTLPNIPRGPMPENIKYFKQLAICYFDFQILDFLRRISPLFNTNQVNLFFSCSMFQEDPARYRAVLNHLAPLLNGIHSLAFHQKAIPLVEQYFTQKLAQIKQLKINMHSIVAPPAIDFCLNWLTSAGERDPDEPKFLKVYTETKVIELFCTAIQQQFLSAKSPCTFTIEFQYFWPDLNNLNDFHLENNIGEQLHFRHSNFATFQIVRHQTNAGTALQEWLRATVEKSGKSGVIRIDMTGNNVMLDVGVIILCAIIGVIIMIFVAHWRSN